MNTFTAGENLDEAQTKLMENLGEMFQPLFSQVDVRTQNNYWALMALCAATVIAQMKVASGSAEMIQLAISPAATPQ